MSKCRVITHSHLSLIKFITTFIFFLKVYNHVHKINDKYFWEINQILGRISQNSCEKWFDNLMQESYKCKKWNNNYFIIFKYSP